MKKLITLTTLFIWGVVSQAQTTYHVTKTFSYTWDERSEDWLYNNTGYPEDMTITIYGNLFTVTDNAKSNYRTVKVVKETENADVLSTTWEATDEKNKRCWVRLCYYKKTRNSYFVVIYSSFKIEYQYED